MIKLYDYHRSSAAYRLRIALNLLGLEYQSETVNLLKEEHKSAEHLSRHPQGMVPVLEIDGQSLIQSLAILDYLEETRGPAFVPSDPVARARVRAVSHAIAVDIHPVLNLSVAKTATGLTEGGTGMRDWMHLFMPSRLAAVETMLAPEPGPYCFGNKVSLADICLMPQLYNAHRWEVDLSNLPRISAIEAELCKLPEFAAAHPDTVGPPA